MVDTYYWLWKSVVPKELCELVINTTDWSKAKKGDFSTVEKDGSKMTVKEEIRQTDIVFKNPMEPLGCILSTYINVANNEANWNFDIRGVEDIQIGHYGVGGHYRFHQDFVPPFSPTIRKISAVLILSEPDTYEGGVLELKGLQEPLPKLPQGSIVVFPSFVEHRVTPVTSGTRYTAVCWAVGPSFR